MKKLCLVGSGVFDDATLNEYEETIRRTGARASWWSFVSKPEVQAVLTKPFYLYINAGGGVFPVRLLAED